VLPSHALHWARVTPDSFLRSPFLQLEHVKQLEVHAVRPLGEDVPLGSGQRVNGDNDLERGTLGRHFEDGWDVIGGREDDRERAVIGAEMG